MASDRSGCERARTAARPAAAGDPGGVPVAAADPAIRGLIDGFLAGDVAAVRTLAGWIRPVAAHRAWGFESVEDVVQATLLILVQNLRAGRFTGSGLKAYARRIARNICVSHYRRSLVRGRQVPLETQPLAAGGASDLESAERRDMLVRILDRLHEDCRRIIRLAYDLGHSRREIAGELGISEGAARVRLFRCLQAARALADRLPLTGRPGGT